MKQCAKCGAAFDCCSDGSGCWCEGLRLSTDALQQLKRKYVDCLCPKCLAEYASPANITLDEE